MGKLVIRYALPAEASLIADISRQTFYETFAESNTSEDMEKFMNEQFSRDTLIKEQKSPAVYFYLHTMMLNLLAMQKCEMAKNILNLTALLLLK